MAPKPQDVENRNVRLIGTSREKWCVNGLERFAGRTCGKRSVPDSVVWILLRYHMISLGATRKIRTVLL